MAEITNPKDGIRFDPYRTFRFQVSIDGAVVAGLRKMTALKRTTEMIGHRSAGDPIGRKLTGGTTYEPVTLEQGLTLDNKFEDWANLINDPNGKMTLAQFRKDVIITVLNMEGIPAIQYQLFDAWVSEYQALPDFDAGVTNSVGIKSVKLEYERWERDPDIVDSSVRVPRNR